MLAGNSQQSPSHESGAHSDRGAFTFGTGRNTGWGTRAVLQSDRIRHRLLGVTAVIVVNRSALALTVTGAFAVSATFLAAPPDLLAQRAPMPTLSVSSEAVALTAFNPIADQLDILYTYGSQAVGETATLVNNLVTPIIQGQFWPVSGYPGNYIANAFNSAANYVSELANTATQFIQAEIDYFGGFVPNVINWAANVVQNVINWITGWLPWPLAAVKTPAVRPAAVRARRAAATAPTEAAAETTAATQQAATAVSTARPAASSGARQAGRSAATARSAASAKSSARGARAAAAASRSR